VFAPFDEPELVVTCIIEQGAGGTEVGYAVRDVFDYYFKQGEWAEQPEETVEAAQTPEN
jgi:cell division protein FtsI/penicillin-binding protein 2